MRIQAKTIVKLKMILEYLLEQKDSIIYPELIEKDLKINHVSIQRFLDIYFSDFIEYIPIGRMKLIRLKDPTLTFDKVLRYYEVRRRIHNI